MAKDFTNVVIVKSRNGMGLLWEVPVGTETPLEPTEPLPAIARSIGTISDGGLSIGEEASGGDPMVDSDGDTVKNAPGTITRNLTFTPWETENPVAMGVVYHPGDITVGTDGKVEAIDDSGRNPTNRKFIMEFETDTGRIGRRTFHNVSFVSRGTEEISYQNPDAREVVWTILRSSEGYYYQTRMADMAESAVAPEDGE